MENNEHCCKNKMLFFYLTNEMKNTLDKTKAIEKRFFNYDYCTSNK